MAAALPARRLCPDAGAPDSRARSRPDRSCPAHERVCRSSACKLRVFRCHNPDVPVFDQLARPLRNLRLSVTDRCNLRCAYCMPEDEYVWLPREDLLQFEEISTLVDTFPGLGVGKVRLTGGEPLMRRDLPGLVRMLASKSGLTDLAVTTNGVLLADQIDSLHQAGLGRVTVSLDTLDRKRFE